jgi:cellobiose-specific phosphotransferase system component IIB
MSRLCSNPEVRFRVEDALRELARRLPDSRLTASGLAHIIHVDDVASVQNALIDAAAENLVTPELRFMCTECGSLNQSVDVPVEQLACIDHGQIQHDPYALYTLTSILRDAAQKTQPEKKAGAAQGAALIPVDIDSQSLNKATQEDALTSAQLEQITSLLRKQTDTNREANAIAQNHLDVAKAQLISQHGQQAELKNLAKLTKELAKSPFGIIGIIVAIIAAILAGPPAIESLKHLMQAPRQQQSPPKAPGVQEIHRP